MARLNPFAKQKTTLARTWQTTLDDHVSSLAWSPDGTTLAAAAVGGPIHLFAAATGKPLHVLPGHGFGTTGIAWSASGRHFASVGQDGKVRFWDVTAGEELRNVAGGAAWVDRLAWCPRQDLLATAAGKKLRFWAANGELVREVADHPSTIADIQWKPREQVLASATYGQLALWGPDAEVPTQRFEWKGSMLVLAWSPDGATIATGDQDATVHFWTLSTGEDLEMAGYPTKVRELSWDPTSRFLATGGGGVPCVWDCSGKGPAGSAPCSSRPIRIGWPRLLFRKPVLFLPPRGLMACSPCGIPANNWAALALAKQEAPLAQLCWAPDDRALATGAEDGTLVRFDVR